jgi:solute carrier family 35 protein F1/2
MYKYGFKGWGKMVWTHGWKYLILSFFDVEGNYFTVLGYRYTTILSMQLLNFWAIVIVMVCSFLFMKVRYGPMQIIGILVAVGGMGVLLGSDKITGANDFPAENQLKGDLFGLLGATCYGFSNALQEFLVSKQPMYEVIGMLAFWGMLINGVQAGIFDRDAFRGMLAIYTPKIGGWIAGFDLLLFIFYSLVPLVFRMGSAAFLNISLLTSNFWGTIIGIHVFSLHVHWMYPIAFVLILCGLVVYFLMDGEFGDQAKPWLGENQEDGNNGVGTARRRLETNDAVII